MGRFTGVLGLLTMLALAYLFSTNRRAIKPKIVLWGLGLQIALAFLVIRWTGGQMLFLRMGNAVTRVLSYCLCRLGICFWRTWETELVDWFHFCLSGVADDYFYRGDFRSAVLPRRDAGGDPRRGLGHAALHGRKRRRIAQRCGEHLHGADGSAADHPAVPSGPDAIRIDDHHDQRHGACLGRNHGGLHRVWRGSAAPADGGDHDRSGNAADFENARARNRRAENHGRRAHGTRRARYRISSALSLAARAKVWAWRSTSGPC